MIGEVSTCSVTPDVSLDFFFCLFIFSRKHTSYKKALLKFCAKNKELCHDCGVRGSIQVCVWISPSRVANVGAISLRVSLSKLVRLRTDPTP